MSGKGVLVVLAILFVILFMIIGLPALIALLIAKGTGQGESKTKQWVAIGFLIGIVWLMYSFNKAKSDSDNNISMPGDEHPADLVPVQ
jgi:amino acid transporter